MEEEKKPNPSRQWLFKGTLRCSLIQPLTITSSIIPRKMLNIAS
jgi:hypothetical protein